MGCQPTEGYVLVKVISGHYKTDSGLYVARTKHDPPMKGAIVAIGPPHKDKKGKEHRIDGKVGDILHFKRYAGVGCEIDRGAYRFISYKDVLAIETKD